VNLPEHSKSARRFKTALAEQGHNIAVVALSDSTRTAQEAADTIGCGVAQIAKSIVFRDPQRDQAVVVITSGSNRVDVAKIEMLVGNTLEKADGNFVKKRLGYAIGGVPPAGHKSPAQLFLDRDLRQYDEIWAAAGSPFSVFRLTPDELPGITKADWHDVAQQTKESQ
jgi:prolyl-tRNA editing enzyme YbaK/EbsC (Cys-tRNA(Pro) deacylase)